MPKNSAKIESERASININKNFIPYKNTKKNQNKVKSAVKTINLFVALIIFLITAGMGIGAYFIVCRNDCFVLNGAQEVYIELKAKPQGGEIVGSYKDAFKVTIIEFGQDISNSVKIETNMNVVGENEYEATQIGTYYIKYSVDSIKYGKIFTIEKIRLINVVEQSENINAG